MDSDQEVVREPFEDESRHESSPQPPNQGVQDDFTSQADQQVVDDQDSDSSMERCAEEDIRFAKSFGINLKDSKSKQMVSACNRLFNSAHIATSCEKAQESETQIPAPIIKESVTSDCIYHKGTFYQKGDIVALYDQDDGAIYFAQLTGFLQDQYCEKSASVNWLVPTRPTSRDFFDPPAYRIGLEDSQLRKLDCMTFVRHCPHDYYLRKIFPTDDRSDSRPSPGSSNKDQSYIWTTMKPCPVPSVRTEH